MAAEHDLDLDPSAGSRRDIVLELKGVSHWFGEHKVLYDIDLKVVRGEIVAVVGPSGCGKSTLLQAILGTHPPRAGEILMNGSPVVGPGRDRGIVYQRYSLYPFLTALENVAFGLMLDQTSLPFRALRPWEWRKKRKRHLAEAAEMLEKVKLAGAIAKYPAELSGGMCQRVAVAQALIMKPQIILLDEPFGALDEATREELQGMLLRLYQENIEAKRKGEKPPYTILLVTHELHEAIYVADRVVGLSQYWSWEEEALPSPPGATIVYDAVAPVFHPDDEREFGAFLGQKTEILERVFSPATREPRRAGLRFWREVAEGKGPGVLAS
jgi:NitT/TauT family transport system ATP-binding protein